MRSPAVPLVIWYAPQAFTVDHALSTYARLITTPEDLDAAHPARVNALVADLAERPPIATLGEPPSGSIGCDLRLRRARLIWTRRFQPNQYGVSVTRAWLVGRAVKDIARQAQGHDLSCFDLDEPQLYHPQWMMTSRRMKMTTPGATPRGPATSPGPGSSSERQRAFPARSQAR